ncbi:3-phytase [Caenibius tardaugens NBRC 16725]|uniref:3-phytase n=1 Tax=Caenibius tardaugens NBRC 16725 TaxID=1219035 RepID=U2ZY21_9SPHN|nr:phytase [Caenibius tardaugens]AZI37322.1 phytase [Caenibius tardaugens NBRC 16725]GAD47423.1 3-phytase [Caenibius tardaugens NBRC 16725]
MRRLAILATLAASTTLAACTTVPAGPAVKTAVVAARAETHPVGTANQDAADDPAIWRNAANPAGSLLVGTDKKAGLYAYGLDGAVRSFVPAGQLNNVALVEGRHGILVAASDRTDPLNSRVAFFALDRNTGALTSLGQVASGPGEAYGLCMVAQSGGDGADGARVYAALKDGSVREIAVSYAPGRLTGAITREWKIPTQIEGCVVDETANRLFVGEEMVGIHAFDLNTADAKPTLFAKADRRQLVADVEGLALASLPDGRRILLASSQGDNAYAAYDAVSGHFLGRFRIGDGAIDGTSETDGIDVVIGDFGPGFPGGLFVAQDGDNGGGTQNFKLVAWDDIAAALGL